MRTRCGGTDQGKIKTGLARNSHSGQPRSLFQQLTDLYRLCCGVLASSVAINCEAAGGVGVSCRSTISLADTFSP